jgi:hypothetical protein
MGRRFLLIEMWLQAPVDEADEWGGRNMRGAQNLSEPVLAMDRLMWLAGSAGLRPATPETPRGAPARA